MSETSLSSDFAEMMHRVKTTAGHDAEMAIATAKLNQIVDPTAPIADKNKFLKIHSEGQQIYTASWQQDVGANGEGLVQLAQAGGKLSAAASKSIEQDWDNTEAQYQNLVFDENTNLAVLAANDSELAFLQEAAQMTRYNISPAGTKLTSREHTPTKIGQTIESIIKIGLINLIADYDAEFKDTGGLRRPLIRAVVSMADHMATQWRRGLNPQESYTPAIAAKLAA